MQFKLCYTQFTYRQVGCTVLQTDCGGEICLIDNILFFYENARVSICNTLLAQMTPLSSAIFNVAPLDRRQTDRQVRLAAKYTLVCCIVCV